MKQEKQYSIILNWEVLDVWDPETGLLCNFKRVKRKLTMEIPSKDSTPYLTVDFIMRSNTPPSDYMEMVESLTKSKLWIYEFSSLPEYLYPWTILDIEESCPIGLWFIPLSLYPPVKGKDFSTNSTKLALERVRKLESELTAPFSCNKNKLRRFLNVVPKDSIPYLQYLNKLSSYSIPITPLKR